MRDDPAGDLIADIRRLPEADLITAVALTMGLFPDEPLFVPSVPASPCCCEEDRWPASRRAGCA